MGDASVAGDGMAAINQAWFVLSDASRRATYDRELRDAFDTAVVGPDTGSVGSRAAEPTPPDVAEVVPRRIWWLFLVTAGFAVTIGIVLLLIAFTQGY